MSSMQQQPWRAKRNQSSLNYNTSTTPERTLKMPLFNAKIWKTLFWVIELGKLRLDFKYREAILVKTFLTYLGATLMCPTFLIDP